MKCSDFGGETKRGNPCQRRAGWGRDASSGPCKYHASSRRERAENGDEVPEPPPGLSEQAQETWRAVMEGWVLSSEELLTLQGAFEDWDLYRSARATVQEEGPVVETGGGGKKRHPAALVARDALRDYRAAIRDLGLSSEVEV